MSNTTYKVVPGSSGPDMQLDQVTRGGVPVLRQPVCSIVVVEGSDGTLIPIDSIAQTLSYNGDDTLNYIQVTYESKTFRQTMTYTIGKVTGISAWVLQ